jgi:predicted MFS family arabinose efflux permease
MNEREGLRARLSIAILAFAAGAIVANLYYAQPLLGRIAVDLGVDEARVASIVTSAQVGYGVGILLLVPLGDRVERRRLVVVLTTIVALALVGVASAQTLPTLAAASALLGFFTIVPQVLVTFAASITQGARMGRAVGTVTGGLLVGILASRTVSGLVGSMVGWRVMYLAAAAFMLLLAATLAFVLPRCPPTTTMPYRALLRSMLELFVGEPIVRVHALLGGATFGAFSAFWTTLAFHLAAPPLGRGPAYAGAYGAIGVAGALAAPMVGASAARVGQRRMQQMAIGLVLAAFAMLAVFAHSLVGIAVAVLVLDVGVQANHVANVTRVIGLHAAMRSRLNTLYMTVYFTGAALGSFLGAQAWSHGGWPWVCGLGALAALFALALSTRIVDSTAAATATLARGGEA